MAATDQAYRNQYSLDIVFAVSSILMLVSVVWMLWDDYRREYKTEQRQFRDVEMAMAQRDALQKMPHQAEFDAAKKAVEDAKTTVTTSSLKSIKSTTRFARILPEKEKAELKLANLKANLDSKNSFYDIEVENQRVHSVRDMPRSSRRKSTKPGPRLSKRGPTSRSSHKSSKAFSATRTI